MDSIWEEDLRFRFMVADVAHQLHAEERESLIYSYRLPPTKYNDKSNLDVLVALEMQGVFSSSTPRELVELLKHLKRMDLVKTVEKWIKREKKDKKGKPDCKSGKLSHIAKDALLKARFDHLHMQAQQLVDQVEKLLGDLAEEGEEHHRQADQLLCECKEQAGDLARTLKEARSAAEVSEKALALRSSCAAEATRQAFKTAASQISEGFTRSHGAASEGRSPIPSPAPSRKGPEVPKKPILPPNRQHITNTGGGDGSTSAGGDDGDHYEAIPPRLCRAATFPARAVHSAPNSPAPGVRRQSKPANVYNAATGAGTPVLLSRSASQHAKELHSVVTRRPIQETGRAVMDDYEDSKPEEYSDMTGDSTGDSGFGQPLLKVPLVPRNSKPPPHFYTPIQHETMDIVGEYDTTGILQEPLYDDVR